jgi:predicted nucleotidyltransferase component of viral defense system
MHSAVETMLAKYDCKTVDEYKNALKEIIQEIALLGLFRGNFFDSAAFYGGTALRIFHGFGRFSEDLDFSLVKKRPNFDITTCCELVKNELAAYGFQVQVSKKHKTADSTVESAFIKGGTVIHLLKIGAVRPPVSGVHDNEMLKIKLEVDTDPPGGAEYEIKYLLLPIPFHVRVFADGSLFAGKLHALLCRNWQSGRVKGRDLYDYVWYLSRANPVNLRHLEKRMKQSGHLAQKTKLTIDLLLDLLDAKFKAINFEQAKRDVLPFIKDADALKQWSAYFFHSITWDKLQAE